MSDPKFEVPPPSGRRHPPPSVVGRRSPRLRARRWVGTNTPAYGYDLASIVRWLVRTLVVWTVPILPFVIALAVLGAVLGALAESRRTGQS